MRDHFLYLLKHYQVAQSENFAKHPLAKIIKADIPTALMKIIPDKKKYLIRGSVGQSRWATIPWVAVFNILITKTAESGFYPVYLFNEDMSGFYLSLNQGVTIIREKFGRDAHRALRLNAEQFRAQLKTIPRNFDELRIELIKSKKSKVDLAKDYEAGNILAKYYSLDKIPINDELNDDLLEILEIYDDLYYNQILPNNSGEKEEDEEKFKGTENLNKFRYHKRIERNIGLIRKVKKEKGCKCEVCEMTFTEVYGVLGKNFIEAHHRIPLSKLKSENVQLDIRKDFAVLCSNCHRMAHRLDDPSDLELLRKIINENKK